MPVTIEEVSASEVASELGAKLSSRSRHVAFLLGAGASKAARLPDLTGLQEGILATLGGVDHEVLSAMLTASNLEGALSRLRRIRSLLGPGEKFGELDREAADRLDAKICAAIIEAVSTENVDLEPFIRFASWAARSDYLSPIEVFTVNYDLLLERGLETVGAPYFDGFVGNLEARFRADLVDDSATLPRNFLRLWKLHGATNWAFRSIDQRRDVVRLGHAAQDGAAAIYPSDEKYDDSRRVPFVVLMDRFRRSLSESETLLIINGYSFGDEHLNELIFDAATQHPRSEVLALCFSKVPETLKAHAFRTPNLSVLSAELAVVGGRERHWSKEEDIPGLYEGTRFLLGDFARLSSFLAGKRFEADVENQR